MHAAGLHKRTVCLRAACRLSLEIDICVAYKMGGGASKPSTGMGSNVCKYFVKDPSKL